MSPNMVGQPCGQVAAVALPSRRATRALQRQAGAGPFAPEVVRTARALAKDVTDQITDVIMAEVSAYAKGSTGRRRCIIADAVQAAVTLFLDVAEGAPTDPSRVWETFSALGHAEALDGHSLDAFRAALGVATHFAAQAPVRRAAAGELPTDDVVQLRSALLGFMDIVMQHVVKGHRRGVREREADPRWLRSRLLDLIVTEGPAEQVAAVAARVGWGAERSVAVCSVDVEQAVSIAELPGDVLASLRGGRLRVIVPQLHTGIVCQTVAAWQLRSPIVVTAAVPIRDVPAAMTWADRALLLIAEGVIPEAPVVRCADHHSTLLLHADPALSRWEANAALAPLAAFKHGYRHALARTLLMWLQTGEDAKGLARRLEVHEHTVRNHKQKLSLLYGDRLRDPDFATLLIFALSAEVQFAMSA